MRSKSDIEWGKHVFASPVACIVINFTIHSLLITL